jgi:acyl-coenzyme A thioesterase 13
MDDVPAGFTTLFRTSPFLELLGLFYQRDAENGGLIIGLRITEKHANARGMAHGGLLMTLADIALGYNAVLTRNPPLSMVTTSLSADFASSAKIGDWLEAHVDIQKVGSQAAFANAYLKVGEERIARISAVFIIPAKRNTEEKVAAE